MEGSQLRLACAEDIPTLVELRAMMFDAMGVDASAPAWRADAARWFAERLTSPDHRFVVVEADGRVVACAVGTRRDAAPSPNAAAGDVLIGNVCTLAEYRGGGLASRAVAALMDWARSLGVGRAELMATQAGMSIYERAGFTPSACPAMRAALAPDA